MTAFVGVHSTPGRPPEWCTAVRMRARRALRELVREVQAQGGFSQQDGADASSVLRTARALTVEQLADALGHLRYDLLLSAAPRVGGEEIVPQDRAEEPLPSATARATAKRTMARAKQHLGQALGIDDEERRGLPLESLIGRAATEIKRLRTAAAIAPAPPAEDADLTDSFRSLLVQHRARQRLSRQALADRCGLAVTTIRDIELGHHSPKLTTVQRIAGALGVPPGELLRTTAAAESKRRQQRQGAA